MQRLLILTRRAGCMNRFPYDQDAANGTPIDLVEHPNVTCTDWNDRAVCRVRGEVDEDLTLFNHPDVDWVLEGRVVVGNGQDASATPTLDPSTPSTQAPAPRTPSW